MQTLKSHGAGEDKDPQARMLAVLSGLAPDTAQKILIVSFAFLVELGAAFELFLATGHSFGERGSNQKPFSRTPERPDIGNIADRRTPSAPNRLVRRACYRADSMRAAKLPSRVSHPTVPAASALPGKKPRKTLTA